ncbi:MAG TPA: iron ABC transporter permease [Stenomitos sp.]
MVTVTSRHHLARRPTAYLQAGLIGAIGLLFLCAIASITFGSTNIDLQSIQAAVTDFNGSTEHLIIRTLRIPRSITAMLAGSAIAVAGALMQGITRNPLADPGILGVNSGAALAVVGTVFLLDSPSLSLYAGAALVGAAISAAIVYCLGSLGRGGLTPLNLTITGAAFAAFASSLTTGVLIVSQQTLDEIRFWLAGSVAGRDFNLVLQVLPYSIFGLAIALMLGQSLTVLSLGEDIARGLGQRTAWVKGLSILSIVLLAGSSVAIAGPIGFVGLIVPHLIRFWVGGDYRWLLPYSAITGAILLLVADIMGRSILQPQELPVGLIMPILGAPFFIYLSRWHIKQ